MNLEEKNTAAGIDSLDEARQRILELEKSLDEAIDVILKRDSQLQAYERKITDLGGTLGE